MTDQQLKLVKALFNGATLARAWAAAGYSKKHHANLPKIMSWPHVRLAIELHIQNGDRLRGELHQKALDLLLMYEIQEAGKPEDTRQRNASGQYIPTECQSVSKGM